MNCEDDSQFVRHAPCPQCGSSDALAIYSDGHSYCFSCEYREAASGDATPAPSSAVQYGGDFAAIRSRRISEETCRKFNVRVDAGPVIRFPYYTASGRLIAYKERDQNKNFRWQGKNSDNQLFGQQLFGKGKTLVVTEGEMDALSVWQARPKWPVVSIPNGAKAAKKTLSAQLPYLMGFDEVILMFDNDEAGLQAAEECVQLFPLSKVFLASLGDYKDASEALQAGDGEAIRQAIWNKRSYSPKSIVDGRTLFELVSTPLHGRDAEYPFPSLNTITGGLRLGELVTACAGSGSGKSTLCGEIAVSLIQQGHSVGYIALEESIKRTGLRLMTVDANKPLHLNNEIPEEDFKKAFDNTVGSGRLWVRDGFGSVDPVQVLNDIRFLVQHHGVQWVILDHLSILMSGLELDDERKCIDRTMTMLRSFCEETQVGMILVSHLRRSQGDKGPEDGSHISLQMLRGSHSIAQLSDQVISLVRNISSGDNTAELVVLKNRFTGETGPAGTLSYNKETGRLKESTIEELFTADSYDDF